TYILKELGLFLIPKADYLYINNKLIVFFYINNIAILSRRFNYNEFLSFKTKLFSKYKI
ncbi:hypothetical protein M430DRAFT_107040, partial [Amorphotheca resinae ATCC 22711]